MLVIVARPDVVGVSVAVEIRKPVSRVLAGLGLVDIHIRVTVACFENLVAFRLQTDVGDLELWADADDVKDLEGEFFELAMHGVADVREVECTELRHVGESLEEVVLRFC